MNNDFVKPSAPFANHVNVSGVEVLVMYEPETNTVCARVAEPEDEPLREIYARKQAELVANEKRPYVIATRGHNHVGDPNGCKGMYTLESGLQLDLYFNSMSYSLHATIHKSPDEPIGSMAEWVKTFAEEIGALDDLIMDVHQDNTFTFGFKHGTKTRYKKPSRPLSKLEQQIVDGIEADS